MPEPSVIDYLRHLLLAARRLLVNDDDTTKPTTPCVTPQDYLTELARVILQVSGDIKSLYGPFGETPYVESENDVLEEHPDRNPIYQYRRTDYLRVLLQATGSISFDLASVIVEQSNGKKLPLIVLASLWLPAAPHLAPLFFQVWENKGDEAVTVLSDNKEHDFVMLEAIFKLCQFYDERQEILSVKKWWNLESLAVILYADNDTMTDASTSDWSIDKALVWFASRITGYLLEFSPKNFDNFLKIHQVRRDNVLFTTHPFQLDQDLDDFLQRQYDGVYKIWWYNNGEEYPCPTYQNVRKAIPTLHSYLRQVGSHRVFYREDCLKIQQQQKATETQSPNKFVQTTTTTENLSTFSLYFGIDPPKPLLLVGQSGSGKSSLVRNLAKELHHQHDLLEIHVDDETDCKTLVGSFVSTDLPGKFEWRPGALTIAVRTGQWVLFEDFDKVPIDIQASLVPLFKERVLPLGQGKKEYCHANFRIFATVTADNVDSVTHNKRILNPSYWCHVPIKPLQSDELLQIGSVLYPTLPSFIVTCVLQVFANFDFVGCRVPSIRDLFKLFARIDRTVMFEKDCKYATESQRTLCMAEMYDVFCASMPNVEQRRHFVCNVAAPALGITADLARQYVENRRPEVLIRSNSLCCDIGRVQLPRRQGEAINTTETFALTSYSLRLIESIGVCVRENEPTLLVGETGCGKTTIVQQLARILDKELVVQNLSLQTDSNDLLGGYRPVEIKQIARKAYNDFVDIFTSTFSRKQNADFLSFTLQTLQKSQWKKLASCFQRAAKMGLQKVKSTRNDETIKLWERFAETANTFDQQRIACDGGLAFTFTEGALIDCIRQGKWILLDEINLASSETLQRICGLLDNSTSSITLTEKGDSTAVKRHPGFRLFAAMNPATDLGKKDLSSTIRSRFTEIYVNELEDAIELQSVAEKYLRKVLPAGRSLEDTELIVAVVELYLKCRQLSMTSLADGSGQRPRYTLRTLSRALTAASVFVLEQRFTIHRALREGFELAFLGPLDVQSSQLLQQSIRRVFASAEKQNEDRPGRKPGGRSSAIEYVLLKPFWVVKGDIDAQDWTSSVDSKKKFVLTDSTVSNLRRLVRAIASGPWPILLEGPTSAGKTTLVEYAAAKCGYKVVRINNHEHTDVQEYTGGYSADETGSLSFVDGILVTALRRGYWVILDELNLAPSDVLEALNRLLDDNRELYLAETGEVVQPHPNFRLFATQNPSGIYGGRKPLSRAFRNRFIELQIDNIPDQELVTILHEKCQCPPSHAKILVKIMEELQRMRSRNGLFLGKDGLITPRDLLRWAERRASTKQQLASEGFMILGERLRNSTDKNAVKEVIEEQLKVKIDVSALYEKEGAKILAQMDASLESLSQTAPTKSFLRLLTLVYHCIQHNEPVLLVGDTGCGKTTVVQVLSSVLRRDLKIVNCHATTETSDLLGGLRPMRRRQEILQLMKVEYDTFFSHYDDALPEGVSVPSFLASSQPVDTTASSDVIWPSSAATQIIAFVRQFVDGDEVKQGPEKDRKRLKLSIEAVVTSESDQSTLDDFASKMEKLYQSYNALFEWEDGPLTFSMKTGCLFLLDELSLAEDAVLERLNSVLEPSRSLTLAEKSSFEVTDEISVKAVEGFQIFGTMNPGGDYGKRELSPALRSRFTEIWVPSIEDLDDLRMVIQHRLQRQLGPVYNVADVTLAMTSYFDWFNKTVCADSNGPFSALSLSLRDLVTWSDFISCFLSKYPGIDIWEVYNHGACLMHLDGLGLGTGLSLSDAEGIVQQSKNFLLHQTSSSHVILSDLSTRTIHTSNGRFGSEPFCIPVPSMHAYNCGFDFNAPTPSLNTLRVLRALQLSKPVLLEGPPGVGKTSLVTAIAAATGNTMVRINLSEQTDVADLFGSDLPIPASEDSTEAVFAWCDGVLLSAIKAGHWVLLDELNLATQTVLEGLNSCLDHRASVYIPQINKTFDCPPSFKVFAAQNPLIQGGGRKGLPKSFLNRFTSVYLQELSHSDLKSIAESSYQGFTTSFVSDIITFNTQLQNDISHNHFGAQGGPWEFNLRDVFRLLEEFKSVKLSYPELDDNLMVQLSFFDTFYQRFRNSHDRLEVAKRIKHLSSKTVGSSDNIFQHPVVKNELCLQSQSTLKTITSEDISIIAALTRCVDMTWPCLLVGKGSSGKGKSIKSLSEKYNVSLIDISLSPSSDVSDLIGGFEQQDVNHRFSKCFSQLCSLLNSVFATAELTDECKVAFRLQLQVLLSAHNRRIVPSELLQTLDKLDFVSENIRDELIALLRVYALLQSNNTQDKGLFRWVDGPLVTAMKTGQWIHVRNANLCPPSVLDRLNSVLEPGGSLLISELGVLPEHSSSASGLYKIDPHTNFRFFMSLNPEYGEISRAMRNRCAEIYFHTEDIDTNFNMLKDVFNSERKTVKDNADHRESLGATIVNNRSSRYLPNTTASVNHVKFGGKIPYNGMTSTADGFTEAIKELRPYIHLYDVISVRIWDEDICNLQLLRIVNDKTSYSELYRKFALISDSNPYESSECTPSQESMLKFFRSNLLSRFSHNLSSSSSCGFYYVDEINSSAANTLRSTNDIIDQKSKLLTTSGKLSNLGVRMVAQLVYERIWTSNVLNNRMVRPHTALSASLLMHKNIAFNDLPHQGIVSLLASFFASLDIWITSCTISQANPLHLNSDTEHMLRRLVYARSDLWWLLASLKICGPGKSRYPFEIGIFCVQWAVLNDAIKHVKYLDMDDLLHRKDMMVWQNKIEGLLSDGGLSYTDCQPIEQIACPIIPRNIKGWNTLHLLLKHSNSLKFDLESRHQDSSCSLIETLLESKHTTLFIPESHTEELLAVLAAFYTQFMNNENDGTEMPTDTLQVKELTHSLMSQLDKQKTVFSDQLSAFTLYEAIEGIGPASADDLNPIDTVHGESFCGFHQQLLDRLGKLQIGPLFSLICRDMEKRLLQSISYIVRRYDVVISEEKYILENMKADIKKFLRIATSQTTWDVWDLYPYQALYWLLSGNHKQSKENVSKLLSQMFCNASNRQYNHKFMSCLLQEKLSVPLKNSSKLQLTSTVNAKDTDNTQTKDCLRNAVVLLLRNRFSYLDKDVDEPFLTLDNHNVRKTQLRKITDCMSLTDAAKYANNPHEVLKYLLLDTVESLKGCVDDCLYNAILAVSTTYSTANMHALLDTLQAHSDPLLLDLQNLFVPLTNHILDRKQENNERLREGSALVYLGLFRFHCLMPRFPLDPTTKPSLKLRLAGEALRRHDIELAAYNSLATLDFPLSGVSDDIHNDSLVLQQEIERQKKFFAERPIGIVSFDVLYDTLHSFKNTLMVRGDILDMLDRLAIENSTDIELKTTIEKVGHWLETTENFMANIIDTYQHYGDVVSPLAHSIDLVRQGLLVAMNRARLRLTSNSVEDRSLQSLIEFPLGSDSTLEEARSNNTSRLSGTNEFVLGKINCLTFKCRSTGYSRDVLSSWTDLVEQVILGKVMVSEFNDDFVETTDRFSDYDENWWTDSEQLQNTMQPYEPTDGEANDAVVDIHDSKLCRLLYYYQRLMFNSCTNEDSDETFWRNFLVFGFTSFSKLVDDRLESDGIEYSLGTTPFACLMSFAISPFKSPSDDYIDDSMHIIHDEFDQEVLSVVVPLKQLLAKTVSLLHLYPENDALLSVLKVTDSLLSTNLTKLSLAKASAAVELILKHAQDWEQYASKKVSLESLLTQLNVIALKWRKIELNTWTKSLAMYDIEFARQCDKFWITLYFSLCQDDRQNDLSLGGQSDMSLSSLPWLWKYKTQSGVIWPQIQLPSTFDIDALFKLLDTFLLVSSIGAFSSRLDMLSSFASHVSAKCKHMGNNTHSELVKRMLISFIQYYQQYSTYIEERKMSFRREIEKKIANEVKLAKWEDQSYYAYMNSRQKNRQKLSRYFQEYNEYISQRVGPLIAAFHDEGMRLKDGVPMTSVPMLQKLVPTLPEDDEESAQSNTVVDNKFDSSKWELFTLLSHPFLSNIQRYVEKMAKISSKVQSCQDSYSDLGHQLCQNLSGAIFDRITALQGPTATRKMKERALVDLMKELKAQGMSNLRLSIPSEVNNIKHVFILPAPEKYSGSTVYEQFLYADEYHQRFVSEKYRLDSEVRTVGSRLLTPRQVNIIQNYLSHGMYMHCQLRSALISNTQLHNTILLTAKSLLALQDQCIPLFFDSNSHTYKFYRGCITFRGLMRQAKFALRSSSLLLSSCKRDVVTAVVATIDEVLFSLQDVIVPAKYDESTNITLEFHISTLSHLEHAKTNIESCQEILSANGVIPHDVFESGLNLLSSILHIGREIQPAIIVDHMSDNDNDIDRGDEKLVQLENAVKKTLAAVQPALDIISKLPSSEVSDDNDNDIERTIVQCHEACVKCWTSMSFVSLQRSLEGIRVIIKDFSSFRQLSMIRQFLETASGVGRLVIDALQIISVGLNKSLKFYRSFDKLLYVLSRIFRSLIANGFCHDQKSTENDDNDDQAGTSGMTFESHDGTGMGEGDGEQDVTDQLEHEEQLLGLKGDEDEKEEQDPAKQQQQQLDKEEVDKGMEMEAEFDGDMYDMPDEDENEKQPEDEKEDGREEIEKNMDDGIDPNEEVIDEKLWNESDDEGDDNEGKQDEKFEKDNPVQGIEATDEMTTKDDEKAEAGDGKEFNPSVDKDNNTDEQNNGENDDEDKVNDMGPEDVEENHGFNLDKNVDEGGENEKDDENENFQLDDNMEIDNNEMDDDKVNDDVDSVSSSQSNQNPDVPDPIEDDMGENNDGGSDNDEHPSTAASAAQLVDDDEEENEDNEDTDKNPLNIPKSSNESQTGLGVSAKDGIDNVQDDENDDTTDKDAVTPQDQQNAVESNTAESTGGKGDGNSEGNDSGRQEAGSNSQPQQQEIPNPLQNPGDFSKYWHRRLNITQNSTDPNDDSQEMGNDDNNTQDENGDFEFTDETKSTTQALAEIDDKDENTKGDVNMEDKLIDDTSTEPESKKAEKNNKISENESSTAHKPRKGDVESKKITDVVQGEELNADASSENSNNMEIDDGDDDDDSEDQNSNVESNSVTTEPIKNQVVSDLSRLNMQDDSQDRPRSYSIVEDEEVIDIDPSNIDTNRWLAMQTETALLSRRLCEKLRLVMEPLVASKLRGDYRTGKRINMKRVIGYIASGYRKDKIWLRRTKPAKRDYRVLLAVDNSESMRKSGETALKALSTIIVGMNQLDVGQVGVASFGTDMRLVHSFGQPFTTTECGVNLLQNFKFDEKRTRTALCVESAIKALEEQTSGYNSGNTVQLVFMISDGRIERDSRATLRRLIREMMEKNILLAMIIVQDSGSSIVNMKEVKFENGKPVVSNFMDGYPFPYYLVIDDVNTLPEVLGDALRQWFEMLAQLQQSGSR